MNPPNSYFGFVEYFRRGDAKETFATKFGFYKIEDPGKCSQKNPYVLEDQEWLDGNRKLRDTMKVQRARYIERLYGLPEYWASYRKYVVTRQYGRCAKCACRLTERNTHFDY